MELCWSWQMQNRGVRRQNFGLRIADCGFCGQKSEFRSQNRPKRPHAHTPSEPLTPIAVAFSLTQAKVESPLADMQARCEIANAPSFKTCALVLQSFSSCSVSA
jgi:hypothetical protein